MKQVKNQGPARSGRNWAKDFGMGLAAVIAVIYLLNPDAGILELIPDNIPIVGNLDEVAATLLLLKIAAYFGWTPFGRKRQNSDKGAD